MNKKNSKLSQKNDSSSLTILIILFVVSAVALCVFLIFYTDNARVSKPSAESNSTNEPWSKNQKGHVDFVEKNKNNGIIFGQPTFSPGKNINENNENSSNIDKSTSSSTAEIKSAILCTEEASSFCLLNNTNSSSFADAFDKNIFATGAIIDGSKVIVEKISHQLVYRSLSSNIVTDSAGKTLASSGFSYKNNTKELVILIGIDKNYYLSLNLSEQKTLYISQFVRAIFSVTGETPSNYPKVSKTVGKLNYWDPNEK